MENNFYKTAFFTLLFIVFVSIFTTSAFFAGRKSMEQQEPEMTVLPLVQGVSEENVTQETPRLENPESLIRESVAFKLEKEVGDLTINIEKVDESFAVGKVKEKNEVASSIFLSTKIGSQWLCVYVGKDIPKCSEIKPFNFPKSILPECNEVTTTTSEP